MVKRIFKSIIAVVVTAVIVTIIFITGFLNVYYSKNIAGELKSEAEMIAGAIELNGDEYLKSVSFNNMRVTWIDGDGTVLYDSKAEASEMENHADRKEFRQAVEEGSGSSTRYSRTLMQKTIYYAKKLSDGTVVRVSNKYLSVWAQLAEMISPFCFIILVVIIVSGVLASEIAKRIVRPINSINLNNPDIDESYSEISPLLHKIRTQNREIRNQVEQLRCNQEQFYSITQNMSEGIIVADENNMILSYNNAALRLFGIDSIAEKQSVYTLDRSEVFRDCIQSAGKGRKADCILENNDKICRIIAAPSDMGGEFFGIVMFIIDETEKQKLEDMRREFTSNVSHELKTPLTAIYGISDMIANGIVKQEDVQKFSSNIRSEADRLIILINDIISLSKLDENSIPENETEIDLYDAAQDVLNRLTAYADERNITMKLSGEHILFSGMATIIDEVIYNLCDNAIKYNKEGGCVFINIKKHIDNAVITVEDTGIGIESQNIDRIFERFYRVDKSHSRKIKGTGLGLSIVKHGVKYHNGTIKCESIFNKGTTFTITLPIK